MKTVKRTLEEVVTAIKGTGGIKTIIAGRLDVSRTTLDKYLKRWASAREAYDQETETNTDFAESIILGNMQSAIKEQAELKKVGEGVKPWTVDSGDAWKYLQYKGRKRGYTQSNRSENINIDLANLTDTQIDRLAEGEDIYAVLTTTGKGGA